jgi:uncharacterized protein
VEDEISIEVAGGPTLEGRLGALPGSRGGLVAAHPHPLYGGDMDNPVVVRAVEVAREEGLVTLRFNFRGVGRSTGVHAKGEGELLDMRAAIEALQPRLPAGGPIGLLGYSFGAWIAARLAAAPGTDLAGLCLVAPPLAMLDFASLGEVRGQVLIAAGTRDPYCPTQDLAKLTARLSGAEVATIDGADHFFFGKLFPLGESIRGWARRWTAA